MDADAVPNDGIYFHQSGALKRPEAGELVLGDKTVLELSDSKRRQQGLGAAAEEVTAIRALWADLANQALERAGRKERVDARSFAARGIDRESSKRQA